MPQLIKCKQAVLVHGCAGHSFKRFLDCALAVVIIWGGLSTTGIQAAERVMSIGIYENPPKILLGPDRQPSGFFGDLLKEIAQKEGWRLRSVPCEWQACLEALEKGKIDLLPDVAYTRERDQWLDFNKVPVLNSWSAIYARKGLKIDSILDLKGRKVAVLGGSIQTSYLSKLLQDFGVSSDLVQVATYEQAFALAANGQVDGAVTNNFFGDLNAERYHLAPTPILFYPSKLFFATGQGRHADLLQAIDNHLNPWIGEEGSPYYRLRQKWMSESPETVLPVWWKWMAGGLFTGIALVLVMNWLLRIKVRRSESRYRSLVEGTSAVTWSCPPSGLHSEPQPQWMAFTGQTAEEMFDSGWLMQSTPMIGRRPRRAGNKQLNEAWLIPASIASAAMTGYGAG